VSEELTRRARRERDRALTERKSLVHGTRFDIQALRAIAVLLVILDHAFNKPTGGYVGVDVFFVISGYLITGQLLREQERTGRISLVGFYKRRVRRILPASVLTLAVTVVATLLVVGPARMRDVADDAAWAAVSLANWHFAAIGTDYSHADGPVSPLQHFWSLAVEEQFYFVWPLLIIVSGVVFRRRRRVLLMVLGTLLAGSFLWATVQTHTAPTVAYFSSATRAWELAAGAMVALLAQRFVSAPQTLRLSMAWAGLLLIFGSAVLMTASTPFPGPWAFVPVLGSALVIMGGEGSELFRAAPFLNVRPVQYLGNISFSLYLWHYPIIILAAQQWIQGSKHYVVAVIVGTAIAATLSYHLVEQPIRKSSWLTNRASNNHSRRILPALSAAVIGALVLTAGALATFTPIPKIESTASLATSSDPTATLGSQIQNAVDAKSWPVNLTPTIDEAPKDASPYMFNRACFNPTDMSNGKECTIGNPRAKHLAVLVGDSIAMSWVPGVQKALGSGWRIHAVGMSNCPFITAKITYSDPAQTARCDTERQAEIDQVKKLHANIVIISDLERGVERLSDGARGETAHREWIASRSAVIREIKPTTGKVFIFTPNPVGVDNNLCSAGGQGPSACVGGVSEDWQLKADADKKAAAATGATFVDTSNWFCTPTDKCPAFVHGILERWDIGHMTQTYSRYLAPLIRQQLLGTA
jgi:peptidoglycan/LPS O-acetylase OafA/YrhL